MSQEVRTRALGAILMNAILSWQSLLTIALTAILFLFVPSPFLWWEAWFWLVAGAIAEVAFIASNLSDPDAATAAVAREFETRYDLRRIKSPVSRERVQSAIEYRRNMLDLANKHRGSMRSSLMHTIQDIDDWIGHMYDLALHVDDFEENELVRRDRKRVPEQLKQAQRRLQSEMDDGVRADIQTQIEQLQRQLDNLNATENSAKRAEIQLESTLTSLGTIYAQMSLLGTKEVDSGRAQRLREEIKEEVAGLQDTIEALDEVQQQRLRLS